MVSTIRFKNFKIFRKWQTLELRPITILIGKNNSGKSAVAKLPTLIAAPLKGEPVNWVNKVGNDFVELGTSFADLVYRRNNSASIELGIYNETTNIEVAYNQEHGILEYKRNGEIQEGNFNGFLLNSNPIVGLSLNIDYIEAIRTEPKPTYTRSNVIYDNIGLKGQNAYAILINDYENDLHILSKVSDWYKENFDGWSIEINRSDYDTEQRYEIKLIKDNLEINIRQTGQGIHQVLPLIVRSYMPTSEPTLIIIEEPEMHLHPAAHGNLAQRFAESYLEDNNRKYLIETHSQNFVLRMRRLVAEGKLKAEDLAIYYVEFDEEENESNLRRIEVDNLGRVNWWPSHIFNETLTETMAIRNAQLDKTTL